MVSTKLMQKMAIHTSVLLSMLLSITYAQNCGCRDGQTFRFPFATQELAETSCNSASLQDFCFTSSCAAEETCTTALQCSGTMTVLQDVESSSSNPRYLCSVQCSGGESTCTGGNATGNGDPHLKGFDGSRFDFHGVANKHYVLFSDGMDETLTARMRAGGRKQPGASAMGTFFDAFGLKSGGHRVQVSLVRDDGHKRVGRLWRIGASVDDKDVKEMMVGTGGLQVTVGRQDEEVVIKTARTEYSIRGVALNDYKIRHLDVGIKLAGRTVGTGVYSGVLGMTLRRGGKLKKTAGGAGLAVSGREKDELEGMLRRRFGVDGLFSEGRVRMPAVVRLSVTTGDGFNLSGALFASATS